MGKGWHSESKRHALARKGVRTAKKSGAATSSKASKVNNAMTRNPIVVKDMKLSDRDIKFIDYELKKKGIPKRAKDLTYSDCKKYNILIKPWKDSDGDGKVNKFDCRPLNKNAQDNGLEKVPSASEADIAAAQEKLLSGKKLDPTEKELVRTGEAQDSIGTYSRAQEADYRVRELLRAETDEQRQKEIRTIQARRQKRKIRAEVKEDRRQEKIEKIDQDNERIKDELTVIQLKKQNKRLKETLNKEKPNPLKALFNPKNK